jgi:hypothetical protein
LPLENPISSLRANAIRFVRVIFLYAHTRVIAQRFFSGKLRRRALLLTTASFGVDVLDLYAEHERE